MPTIWLDVGMTTATAHIRYRGFNAYRRNWLRIDRGSKDITEAVAEMLNPQFGWGVDPNSVPPTPEQWRQIGLGNGVMIR